MTPCRVPGGSRTTRWPRISSVTLPGSEIRSTSWADRKSTRLNSSHLVISYAVVCLKKKKNRILTQLPELIYVLRLSFSSHSFLVPVIRFASRHESAHRQNRSSEAQDQPLTTSEMRL